MTKKYAVLIGVSVATIIGAAFLVIFIADNTAIHSVEDQDDRRIVRLFRTGVIADVRVTPSKERVHVDIHYDVLITRHFDVETNGKVINIYHVCMQPASMHADHFIDQAGTRWEWDGRMPLEKLPTGSLRGLIFYNPGTDTCMLIWRQTDDSPIQGAWIRKPT
jgi:hypothetical protein